jgi:hypothetical protein
MPDDYMTPEEFAALPSDAHHAVWRAHAAGRLDSVPECNVRRYHRAQVLALLGEDAPLMAVTPEGTLKPVSEFTPAEKWWCDGEDCNGGPLGPSLPVPHVHPYTGPALAVDLLTGWTAARA